MYKNTKQVKEICGDKFVKDFKSVRDIVVYAKSTNEFFAVGKMEVWEAAKVQSILYYVSKEVYKNRREVMVIF